MLKTLERYQNCSYGSLEVSQSAKNIIEHGSYNEYLKLKFEYESLQQYQRHLLGDDLAPLSMNDLELHEHQLDTSLKSIRSTRTQVLVDRLSDLRAKEKSMLEANKALERKLEEIQHVQRSSWVEGGGQHAISQGLIFQPLHSNYSPHNG